MNTTITIDPAMNPTMRNLYKSLQDLITTPELANDLLNMLKELANIYVWLRDKPPAGYKNTFLNPHSRRVYESRQDLQGDFIVSKAQEESPGRRKVVAALMDYKHEPIEYVANGITFRLMPSCDSENWYPEIEWHVMSLPPYETVCSAKGINTANDPDYNPAQEAFEQLIRDLEYVAKKCISEGKKKSLRLMEMRTILWESIPS